MSKILVIEDNPQNARMVIKLLERAGHTVVHYETGEDGLHAAQNQQPDLALVDLGLPDMDGQTVIAFIRQTPTLAGLPIIIFTAWPVETAHEMARAYGCDGVIIKPLDTRNFIPTIEAHLGTAS
jgi:CheY-like chemotaxis protein